MNYLILFIVFGSALLVLLPFKFKGSGIIKKFVCVNMVALLLALPAAKIIPSSIIKQPFVDITVTATGEKNQQSGGTEIILHEIFADNKKVDIKNIFKDSSWVDNGEGLQWRDFDKPEGISNEIKGKVRAGHDYQLVFDQNRWRGIVNVDVDGQTQKVDLYSDQESSSYIPLNFKVEPVLNIKNLEKFSFLLSYIAVAFVLLIFYILDYKKNKNITVNKPELTQKERETWADVLRVFSSFCIVWLHATCDIYPLYSVNDPKWYPNLYINVFTTFAVPCFFILSGAFLLKKEETIAYVLKNRVAKIVVPLFVWSVFYIFVNKYYWMNDISIIRQILAIPFAPQYWHLWFLYTIAAIYLLLPLVSRAYNQYSIIFKNYGIILILFVPSFLVSAAVLLNKSYNPEYALFFPYLGLFCLGGYLYENKNKFKGKFKIFLTSAICSYIFSVLITYYFSVKNNTPRKDFLGPNSFMVVLLSISIFLMFLSSADKFKNLPQKIKYCVGKISDLTLGVFLVHMVFRLVVNNTYLGVMFSDNSFGNINMTLGAVLYFAVSLAFCYVVSKIPYMKKIV